ncbi:DUF5067 domain-containing protein [Staphylococcus pasteuri]|uniref:DUF5067 domain-containing protein n=1 Tax=Staphylococcus pasteuri TaxID=45972 RepID=UPI001AD86ABE|nr:DUF5067 domain-containing protein [Staphylococcus pasteuri]MBM6506777.1 DUF5067 domain-containing protein [Staphylococcus pasteuri]QQT21454.1 DUF5067 domain-containing protein [Staphylococcus pasteuri]
MKKVLFLIFASLLVLGACSNGGSNKSKSIDESKPQFKNDTLVLDQAVLYIKDAFIVKNKDTDKKEIAFKYEVKNKTNKEEITPGNVWSAGVEVKQEKDNTDSSLDIGTTIASGGKYKEWLEHNEDTIKKDKTAKGLATYELKNDNKVTLHFSQGAGGKDLGTKQYDLSKLKTVNYSTEEDVASASISNSTTDSESESTSKNDNGQTQSDNGNNKRPQGKQAQAIQQNNKSQQQNNNNGYMTQDEINEWNRTKPTTHNESQMEKVPQESSGGHPSAFGKSDVPVGTQKTDSNGDTYIDATGK